MIIALAKSYSLSVVITQWLAKRAGRIGQRMQHRRQRARFQRAVTQAHREFAAQHPRWADSLFDRHFVATDAECVLAPIYTHNRWPTAYELAAAYLRHLGSHRNHTGAPRLEMIMPIARDFLSHLETAWQGCPLLLPVVDTPTPARLQLSWSLPEEQPHITMMQVGGELNRHTYIDLIEAAVDCHIKGGRSLLLDLRQVRRVELAGLFALHSIARLYAGESLLDPEAGWVMLRSAAERVTPAMSQQVKLLAPPPAIAQVIQNAALCHFLEQYNDLDKALNAFAHPGATS